MNRSELIAAVADELVMNGTTKTTKKDAGVMVDTIVDIIAKTLASGEKVVLSGFGTLDINPNVQSGFPLFCHFVENSIQICYDYKRGVSSTF